jgi:hydrophobe/amphiphile efflux-3 (HAE3) family protein
MLPKGDPEYAYFQEFSQRFGFEQFLVLGVEAPDVFAPEVLAFIRRVTERARPLPGIKEVLSLANATSFSSADGALQSVKFLDRLPATPEESAAKRREALANPDWVRTLVSADGTMATVTLIVDLPPEDISAVPTLMEAVDRILEDGHPPGTTVFATGIPALARDSLVTVKSDYKRFLWLTPLLTTLLLFGTFRTWRGVIVPLLAITLTGVWTLGLFFLAGHGLTMVLAMMPALIALICLSDAIHITAHYYEMSATHTDRRFVLLNTMEHMLSACFLTSVTTAAGFGSMVTSQIPALRSLGVWTSVGVGLGYVLVIVIVPIVLSYLPLPPPRVQVRYGTSLSAVVTEHLSRFVVRSKVAIPLLTVLVLAVGSFGVRRVEIETQISDYLPAASPSVQGLERLRAKMAGFSTLEICIEGEPGAFKQPWALREVQDFQDFLDGLPEVDDTISLVHVLRRMHATLEPEDARRNPVPQDAGAVADYLFLLSTTDHHNWIRTLAAPDYSALRLCARIKPNSTSEQLVLIAKVEDYLKAHPLSRLSVRITGMGKMFASAVRSLVQSQLWSLVLSIVLITVLMALFARSIRVGVLSVIPNAAPAITTLGLMGWSGIALNGSTVMISAIAIGIAVDNAIHFLARYRWERATHTGNDAQAIRGVLCRTGRAMIFATSVIAGGFSVLIFSNFIPNRYFGLLTAYTLLVALVADLLLLPWLLLRVHRPWKPAVPIR